MDMNHSNNGDFIVLNPMVLKSIHGCLWDIRKCLSVVMR